MERFYDDPDFVPRPEPEIVEHAEPSNYEEFYAEEAEFEKWDTLKNCPRCKEPQGWILCPNCHKRP